jgi:MFS family permease
MGGRRRAVRAYRKFDRFVGRRETAVFSLVGRFMPDTSVIHSRRLQHLLFAKALSDMARDATKYAALVLVVSANGSPLQSSLMAVATLIPAAALGLYAGEVADTMPKRLAIATSYGLAGVACFAIPTLYGTAVTPMFALVLLVAAFAQLATPAENSAVPLVANAQQLSSATSMMSLASSVGTALGTALLAPLLLKLTSARVVFYVTGLLLFAATTRVLHIYSKRDVGTGRGALRVKPGATRRVLSWVFQHPGVATMVAVSVLVGVSNVIMSTLAPIYVRDVLDANPADTVYLMAPAGIAMTASLLLAPPLIRWLGERVTAAFGFGLVVLALTSLGLVERHVSVVIDPVNPLRFVGFMGHSPGETLRTAMFLSAPLGLGVGLTDNAVKTYINRRVPFPYQARTFAARSALESGIAIGPLLAVSGLASLIGVSTVLVLTPVMVYALILILLQISRRFGADPGDARTVVTKTFWSEPDDSFAESPAAVAGEA